MSGLTRSGPDWTCGWYWRGVIGLKKLFLLALKGYKPDSCLFGIGMNPALLIWLCSCSCWNSCSWRTLLALLGFGEEGMKRTTYRPVGYAAGKNGETVSWNTLVPGIKVKTLQHSTLRDSSSLWTSSGGRRSRDKVELSGVSCSALFLGVTRRDNVLSGVQSGSISQAHFCRHCRKINRGEPLMNGPHATHTQWDHKQQWK